MGASGALERVRALGGAAGEVADVAEAGLDVVAVAEEAGDGFGLGAGFDDDEGLAAARCA